MLLELQGLALHLRNDPRLHRLRTPACPRPGERHTFSLHVFEAPPKTGPPLLPYADRP